ncbi:hypothetical protein [Marivita sp.]|uniref:hypothetical protein n=1 Tax=Marivita sp. TaxID=2003365 RepID=UPI003F72842D
MFSPHRFSSDEEIQKSLELSGFLFVYGENTLNPELVNFCYDQNYDPRFFAQFSMNDYASAQGDQKISFKNIAITEEFIQIKTTMDFSDKWSAIYSPRTEPFLWGDSGLIDKATFVVLNGPYVFFSNRSLEWRSGDFRFEYSMFDEVRECLKDPRLCKKKVIASGTLTVFCENGTTVMPDVARMQAYLASLALTFISGIGVSIGHGELSKDEVISSHYIGFIRCDPLTHHKNWFDIEIFKDAGDFSERYMQFLVSEPKTSPVTYATDFYRTSNAIRDSSLEMAVIASYSALEVLVSYILREEAGWSSSLLGPRTTMADKMRACTRYCGLRDTPLSKAKRIRKKLKSFNNYDDYDVFSETRNSIVHADKSFKLEGFELHEVWLASQWLVEVLVFYMIDYRGMMADRRPMTGWRGEYNCKVPLA